MTVRRVRRVVRKIDPWTVLKVSMVFWTVAGLAGVLGMVISWSLLDNAGVPDSITNLIAEVGGPEITIEGGRYLRVVIFLGIVSVIMLTGLTTLAAVLYNLISDVVGGVEFVVLEEVLPAAQVRPAAPLRPAVHTELRTDQPRDGTGGHPPRPEPDRKVAELPTEESSVDLADGKAVSR